MGSHVFKHENISHRIRNSSPQFSYVNGDELYTQNDAISMGSKKFKPKVITMELQQEGGREPGCYNLLL